MDEEMDLYGDLEDNDSAEGHSKDDKKLNKLIVKTSEISDYDTYEVQSKPSDEEMYDYLYSGQNNNDCMYRDMLNPDANETMLSHIKVLEEKVKKAEHHIALFKSQITILTNLNKDLREKNTNCEKNLSSLKVTARTEINRKNEQITSLRLELDDILFRRSARNINKMELDEILSRHKSSGCAGCNAKILLPVKRKEKAGTRQEFEKGHPVITSEKDHPVITSGSKNDVCVGNRQVPRKIRRRICADNLGRSQEGGPERMMELTDKVEKKCEEKNSNVDWIDEMGVVGKVFKDDIGKDNEPADKQANSQLPLKLDEEIAEVKVDLIKKYVVQKPYNSKSLSPGKFQNSPDSSTVSSDKNTPCNKPNVQKSYTDSDSSSIISKKASSNLESSQGPQISSTTSKKKMVPSKASTHLEKVIYEGPAAESKAPAFPITDEDEIVNSVPTSPEDDWLIKPTPQLAKSTKSHKEKQTLKEKPTSCIRKSCDEKKKSPVRQPFKEKIPACNENVSCKPLASMSVKQLSQEKPTPMERPACNETKKSPVRQPSKEKLTSMKRPACNETTKSPVRQPSKEKLTSMKRPACNETKKSPMRQPSKEKLTSMKRPACDEKPMSIVRKLRTGDKYSVRQLEKENPNFTERRCIEEIQKSLVILAETETQSAERPLCKEKSRSPERSRIRGKYGVRGRSGDRRRSEERGRSGDRRYEERGRSGDRRYDERGRSGERRSEEQGRSGEWGRSGDRRYEERGRYGERRSEEQGRSGEWERSGHRRYEERGRSGERRSEQRGRSGERERSISRDEGGKRTSGKRSKRRSRKRSKCRGRRRSRSRTASRCRGNRRCRSRSHMRKSSMERLRLLSRRSQSLSPQRTYNSRKNRIANPKDIRKSTIKTKEDEISTGGNNVWSKSASMESDEEGEDLKSEPKHSEEGRTRKLSGNKLSENPPHLFSEDPMEKTNIEKEIKVISSDMSEDSVVDTAEECRKNRSQKNALGRLRYSSTSISADRLHEVSTEDLNNKLIPLKKRQFEELQFEAQLIQAKLEEAKRNKSITPVRLIEGQAIHQIPIITDSSFTKIECHKYDDEIPITTESSFTKINCHKYAGPHPSTYLNLSTVSHENFPPNVFNADVSLAGVEERNPTDKLTSCPLHSMDFASRPMEMTTSVAFEPDSSYTADDNATSQLCANNTDYKVSMQDLEVSEFNCPFPDRTPVYKTNYSSNLVKSISSFIHPPQLLSPCRTLSPWRKPPMKSIESSAFDKSSPNYPVRSTPISVTRPFDFNSPEGIARILQSPIVALNPIITSEASSTVALNPINTSGASSTVALNPINTSGASSTLPDNIRILKNVTTENDENALQHNSENIEVTKVVPKETIDVSSLILPVIQEDSSRDVSSVILPVIQEDSSRDSVSSS